jgi:multicomponent Na+:H+ antiporter subunit F
VTATAVATVVLVILSAALVLAFVRLWRGPSVADRVVALDLLSTLAMGLITAYAVATGEEVLLDAVIVLALITFVATVAFAKHIERRALGG